MLLKKAILFFFIFGSTLLLHAQDLHEMPAGEGAGWGPDTVYVQDSVPAMLLNEKAENLFGKLFKYMPVPYIGYSTETSLTFGIIKYNSFRMHSSRLPDSLIMLSSVSLYGFYTLNNQYEIKLMVDLMNGGNRFNTEFEFRFRDFPLYYYGVGNDTPEEDGVMTDFKNLLISPGFSYEFYGKNYIGLKYIFDNYINVNIRDTVTGFPDLSDNEGIQSGFGVKYFREGRDNRLEPTRGSYLFVSFDLFHRVLGSSFNYNNLVIDLRKYYSPARWITFAGQLYSEVKGGNVPVQSLSQVGGKYRMRGFYRGRYRDKTLALAQLEMRFPMFWIVGGALFGGMGQVGPGFGDFNWNGFHYAGGGGLRLLIDKSSSAVLRADVGFSNQGYTIFLGFGEAF